MEISSRFEFHLVGARKDLEKKDRSYQAFRTDYVRNDQGKVMWMDFPQPTALIVPRSEMERIEKMRRLSIKKHAYDPLPDMVYEAEREQEMSTLIDPYRILRERLKIGSIA